MKQYLIQLFVPGLLLWASGLPLSAQATQPAAAEDAPKTAETKKDVPAQPAKLVLEHRPWSYYKPLTVHNIFTRARAGEAEKPDKPVKSATPSTTADTQPQPEWVLTGIVIHADENLAFFENSRTHVTLRLKAGEEIGPSRLTSIRPDSVLLTTGGEDRSVQIGTTIDGSTASLGDATTGSVFGDSTPATSSTGSSATSSGSTPVLDDASKMSIIERMRARRLQESSK